MSLSTTSSPETNDSNIEIVTPVCHYEWTNKLTVNSVFRTQWEEKMREEADSDIETRNMIAISLVGGLASEREYIANCLFRSKIITDDHSAINTGCFMTCFDSARFDNSLSSQQSVVVFNYADDYLPQGYMFRVVQTFNITKIVRFSMELSSIVILCYSHPHQHWTSEIDSIWEVYLHQLHSVRKLRFLPSDDGVHKVKIFRS